jgi:hypothetical protein
MANVKINNPTTFSAETTFNTALMTNSPIESVPILVGSGTVSVSMPFQGSSYKKVVIYMTAFNGATGYNFPIAFTHTPAIIVNSDSGGIPASAISALTTSSMTLTGMTDTGFIFLEGF